MLLRNRGKLMTHRALLREVWGHAYEDDTQTLRVHIGNLRRKIEDASPLSRARDRPIRESGTASARPEARLHSFFSGAAPFLMPG